jgi:hypothetical protein
MEKYFKAEISQQEIMEELKMNYLQYRMAVQEKYPLKIYQERFKERLKLLTPTKGLTFPVLKKFAREWMAKENTVTLKEFAAQYNMPELYLIRKIKKFVFNDRKDFLKQLAERSKIESDRESNL